MKRADAFLLGILALAALSLDDRASGRLKKSCDPMRAIRACDGGDAFECEWGRLLRGRGDVASLARVVEGAPVDLDQLLRTLFPEIGDRPLVDEAMPVPSGLTFELPNYPRYELPVPVDWGADPFQNVSWRFWFQSLSRLYTYWNDGDRALEAGAALVVDWVERALYERPPPDQTWEDYAIAVRLDRTVQLTDRYLVDRPVLNRRYLHAAAQLIITHLYALAADCCYTERHNHGAMQDLELLRRAKKYSALRDGARMFELAGQRLLDDQVRHSVTDDGVHVENSGCYHRLYVSVLNGALVLYRDAGEPLPAELVGIRDAMLEPLVQHLQPDGSFAQFGDCSNEDQSRRLRLLLDEIDELGVGDPATLAPLEWVVTGGERGSMPALDRVYESGGYAMFRNSWGPDAISAHFKTGHLSRIHYHPDETSFEIFAHGHTLLTNPGSFTYAEHDPLYAYQRSAAAHNMLVVDEDATVRREIGDGRVLAHGRHGDTSWVQGTHENYRRLGVRSLVRTFAFARPDTFVVVDHVRAGDEHDYAQHFHLSPRVSGVSLVGDAAAAAAITGGPTVTIAGTSSQRFQMVPSWRFPALRVKEAAHDVVLHHRGRDADLPVVIVVTAPGEDARVAEDIDYTEEAGVATISWRLGDARHRVQVPAR